MRKQKIAQIKWDETSFSGQYWEKTAAMFGQIFDEKPIFTELVLCHPTFRYLHEIFLATIEATGFGKGIFVDVEMDSKSDINTEYEPRKRIIEKMIKLIEMTL